MNWEEWLDLARKYLREDSPVPPESPTTRDIYHLILSVKDIQRLYERSNKRGEHTCGQMYREAIKALEE